MEVGGRREREGAGAFGADSTRCRRPSETHFWAMSAWCSAVSYNRSELRVKSQALILPRKRTVYVSDEHLVSRQCGELHMR